MANQFESWGDAFAEGGDGCWETVPTRNAIIGKTWSHVA